MYCKLVGSRQKRKILVCDCGGGLSFVLLKADILNSDKAYGQCMVKHKIIVNGELIVDSVHCILR
jgi:hypothetical protein